MIEVVDTKLLEDVAGMMPSAPPKSGSNPGIRRAEFDLERWIESREIPVRREGAWNRDGYRWVLEECPWNGHADNASFIVRWPDGTIGAGCHHDSCKGYGWRDLREHYEPGCYDKRDAGSDAYGHRGGHSSDLGSDGESSYPQVVPRFPTEVLPRTLRRFVEEAAASIGCPAEYIGVPMLATLGAAIGNSRVLEIKGSYTEGAALYTAIIGDPGSSKSPALALASAPALKKQEELAREYREALAEYNRVRRQWEGGRNEDVTDDPPQKPVYRRNVVQDTTVEALIEKLAQNPRGLLSSNDEISGWVRQLDQYKGGKGNDRQFWLSSWSNGPVAVDRKGKDPLMVSRSSVSIAGGIQPGILSELKNDREDGLMDRFLFAYPDPMSTRWSDSEVSAETMAAYEDIYEELYALRMDIDENGIPVPSRATFMPAAKQAFIEAYDSLCKEMEHPDFPAHLRGPWSKMRSYVARISLIIGMARLAELTSRRQGDFCNLMRTEAMIGEGDVKAAIALVDYFEAHTRRVYAKLHNHQKSSSGSGGISTVGADNGTDLVQYLEQFLRNRGGYWQGTTSELYEILKNDAAPGLPGGANHLGRRIREIAADPDNEVDLAGGHLGRKHVIKLSLPTLGTVGSAWDTPTETIEGTEGKNEGDNATADHPSAVVYKDEHLAEVRDAMERLLQEHPESAGGSDLETIAVELFWWGYLDYIPEEGQIEEVLKMS